MDCDGEPEGLGTQTVWSSQRLVQSEVCHGPVDPPLNYLHCNFAKSRNDAYKILASF